MPPARVLVIDDHPDGLVAVRELLGTLGYDVDCAATAHDGLARFFARTPNVVVVDLLLPDSDGCDAISQIRAASPRDVFIIAHSGYAQLCVSARAAGADVFVLKPDLDGLLAALDRADVAVAARRSKGRNA